MLYLIMLIGIIWTLKTMISESRTASRKEVESLYDSYRTTCKLHKWTIDFETGKMFCPECKLTPSVTTRDD